MALTLRVTDRFNRKNWAQMDPAFYPAWLASNPPNDPWAREKQARRMEQQQAQSRSRTAACPTMTRRTPAVHRSPNPVPVSMGEALRRGCSMHEIRELQRRGLLLAR